MRTLNLRFLAVLGLAGLTLGTGAFGLHRLQVRRAAGALLREARRAETQGRLDRAETLMGRYLALKPDDPEALAWLGLILDTRAQTPAARSRAYTVLERALRGGPSRSDVRRRLAAAALDLERPADARTHLNVLLRMSPGDANLENMMGLCFEAEGDAERAAEWYELARRHDPRRLDAARHLAAVLRDRLHAPERADRVIDAMIEANPKSYRARLDRAAYRTRNQLAGAGDDLKQARALAPDEPEVLLATARSARVPAEVEAARDGLSRGLARRPGDVAMIQALAELDLTAGDTGAAIDALRRGVAAAPDVNELRWALASLLAQRGATVELAEQTARLREGRYTSEALAFLEAALSFNQGDWRAARAKLRAVEPTLEPWPALRGRANDLLGQCLARLEGDDLALPVFRRAVNLDPESTHARLALAALLASRGKTDQAAELYRGLIAKTPEARLPLARILLVRNLDRPEAERSWAEVDRLVEEATAATGSSHAEPALLRAEALVARSKPDAARRVLEALRDRDPKQVEPWLALSALAAREATPDAALAVLDAARRAAGDAFPLRLERIRLLARRDGAKAADALACEATEAEALPAADRLTVLRALGAEFLRNGDATRAARLWTEVAAARPDDADLRLALLDLAVQADDAAALGRLVDELKHRDGEKGTRGRYAEARLLIWKGNKGERAALDAGRALLAAERPDWPLVPLARAEAEERAGRPERALAHYLRAIELGERRPSLLERAARLLFASRRHDEAEQLLRKLPASTPLTEERLRLTTGLAVRHHDDARARTLARQAVAARPGDYRELLWLAQVLWATGQRDEAREPLRKAAEIAPNVPETWVSLVRYLVRTGRTAEAEAALARAESTNPKQAKGLAECHEALGHAARAESLYQAARKAAPNDVSVRRALALFLIRAGRFPDAEARLREILGAPGATVEETDWARRALAMILTLESDPSRVREALALLGGEGQGGGLQPPEDASSDDLRAWARVLVALKGGRPTREAIRVLERLAEHEPLTDGDRLLLAQLHEANRDWPKARALWHGLASSQPTNPVPLARLAAGLIRNGQAEEARPVVARLEAVAPRAFGTVALKARLLTALGHPSEAVALVAAIPKEHRDGAAALLEELGRPVEAEAAYREAAESSGRSEALLSFAGFLGRRDRPGEALDLCERAWAGGRPEAVARASVGVLDAPSASGAEIARVGLRLERALDAQPDAAPLLVALASVRERQGRFAEAEALDRQAIARNGRDGVALNNLAWLMALRNGDHAAALGLIDRAIDLLGPDPELLDTRAVVRLAAGRDDRAADDLNEAVAASPSATKYYHLALVRLRGGTKDQALDAYRLMERTMTPADRRLIDREEAIRAEAGQPDPLRSLRDPAKAKDRKLGALRD